MRLPSSAHTDHPWRIHEIADDFELEDVWILPTHGGPDDLAHLVKQFTEGEKAHGSSLASRALFALRWKLGALFGWDRPQDGIGGRVATLRDRLPADLKDAHPGPDMRALPFKTVYRTHDEWVAETANKTMHGVMHISWVPDEKGGYRGQMAVLVKPNGRLGRLYMLGIKPFRYLGVYPALLNAIGRKWQETAPSRAAAA
ncbi:DUF2867 domain-containing protein [Yinghuangia soli]|uniref:DUF2867 domain-containing protein n=1 Tax=Yinghuangia soli TaxID=2908204 RepID=A0AA41QAS2_9ACTN|nr:DUF2867 domain-containing protein [Yinghuangia soli]MCF2533352.1 DUF2867 domain-containing protein [Yinghuangia soli]